MVISSFKCENTYFYVVQINIYWVVPSLYLFIYFLLLLVVQVTMAKRFQTTVLSVLIHHDVAKLNNISNCLPKELPSTEVVYLLLPLIAGKVDWPCIKSAVFSAGTIGSQDTMSCCCRIGVARFIQTIDGHICSCQLQNSLVYTPHNHHFYCVTGILDDLNVNSQLKLKCGDVLTYKNYYKTR